MSRSSSGRPGSLPEPRIPAAYRSRARFSSGRTPPSPVTWSNTSSRRSRAASAAAWRRRAGCAPNRRSRRRPALARRAPLRAAAATSGHGAAAASGTRHAADQQSVEPAARRGASDEQHRPALGRQTEQLRLDRSLDEFRSDVDTGHAAGRVGQEQACGTTPHLNEVIVGEIASEHFAAWTYGDSIGSKACARTELRAEVPSQPCGHADGVPRRLVLVDGAHHRTSAYHVAKYLEQAPAGGGRASQDRPTRSSLTRELDARRSDASGKCHSRASFA